MLISKVGYLHEESLTFRQISDINTSSYLFPCSRTELLGRINDGHTWIMNDDDVVGYLIAEIKETQPYIWSVNTHPDKRRQGIAMSLIKASEQFFRKSGHTSIWLHVDVHNLAQEIYESLGYVVESVKYNYYKPFYHAFVMRKTLK